MKVVSVRLEDDLLDKLDRFCNRYNITRSDAIRYLIQRGVPSVKCPICGREFAYTDTLLTHVLSDHDPTELHATITAVLHQLIQHSEHWKYEVELPAGVYRVAELLLLIAGVVE